MFGWRKRKDGFEWREYVRTTILVRRKNRRDRFGEAGKAAVENLKAAGQRGAVAGAEGAKAMGRGAVQAGQQGAVIGAARAKAMGRGAVHYGQQGAMMGVAGAKVAGAKLRDGLPVAGSYLQSFGAALLAGLAYTWAVLRSIGALIADYSAPLLAPVGRVLRQPSVRTPLIVAGSVALLGGTIRAFVNGFESDTWIALLIGVGVLGALFLARLAESVPVWLASPFAAASDRLRGRFRGATAKPVVQGAFAVLVLAVLIAGGVMAWRSTSDRRATARSETRQVIASGDVEGRGSAISGDTLRVGATTVRLSGIEAPEPDQTCAGSDGQDWSCGQAAKQGLARILRDGRVVCHISGSADGQSRGDCRLGDLDIAAELVRGGYVFAASGLFASYGSLEKEARTNKAGIWVGAVTRPSDYRAQKWEEAKREAPDGCPIKGSVRGSRRFYVVPWARGYERVKVSRSRGERWFCSESEAQEAGFRPSEQS